MRFAVAQKLSVFAMVLFSALPLIFSSEIGIGFQIAFFGSWVAGWFLPLPFTRQKRYRRAVTGVLSAVTAVQIARVALGMPMAMGAMELIAALLSAKLIDRASASDEYQIVLLSFLHIIASTVVMDDLLFGVCFLGFTATASPALAMIHLRQEMESRFGPGSKQQDGERLLDRLFRSKRVVTPQFIVGSALLSVPVLVITVALFVVFPRFGFGFFGRLNTGRTAVGFGDTVSLGDFNISKLEDTVLIRLEPVNRSSHLPSRLSLKIRAAVFEKFDGNTWTRSKSPKWESMNLTHRGYALDRTYASDFFEYDVLLESMEPKLLALPDGTGWIFPDPLTDGRGDVRPRVLVIDKTGEIEYEDAADTGIRYRVGITGASPPGAAPNLSSDALRLYPNSERLEKTAAAWAGKGTDQDKAARLVHALKSRYQYSLQLADDEKNSLEAASLTRFLYSRKTGTCEHFATALTLMLRAVGIPARLVTGFMGADWNPVGEFYSVRQQYAHAWSEAFIDGRWVILDATPPSTAGPATTPPSFFAMLKETVEMQWRKRVVGYDLSTQGKLALGLLNRLRKFRSSADRTSHVRKLVVSAAVAAVVAALSVLLFWLYKKKRSLFCYRTTSTDPKRSLIRLEATKIYLVLERRLRHLGYPRPAHLTPEEHLYSIGHAAKFSLTDAFAIARRYNEVRFGNSTFRKGERKSLLLSVKQLGRMQTR